MEELKLDEVRILDDGLQSVTFDEDGLKVTIQTGFVSKGGSIGRHGGGGLLGGELNESSHDR